MGVIITILVFSFLITFHEFGHFITAKLSGITVEEFSVGMGPAFFKRTYKGTQYSLRILPIGGYCKMEGEEEENDSEGSFSNKPLYTRFIVVVAGSVMNFIAGFLIFAIMVASSGVIGTTVVSDFREGMDSHPTQEAGLMAGDRIVKLNSTVTHISDDIVYYLTSRGDEPTDITVERNGETIVLKNVTFPYETYDKSEITGSPKDEGKPYHLVYTDFYVTTEPATFGGTIQTAFYKSLATAKLIWVTLGDIVRGKVGVTELSGPIGVGSAISSAIKVSWESFWRLVAFITINLAVVNLLPLPALDGGRIVFMIFELIARRPVPPEKENLVHFVGLVAFLLLAVFIAYQDIVKLLPS
ncbi:MAG: site-2 protease family protein [Clostridia bacterium]|nr:site-2 protease family protein [Clostridia bacterium]MBQ1375614.1 site-2 protease family protein [Clostridia bacterium]MBQ1436165.1 site-2 protease family protein [Clostridia bacterium]MBQ4248687.1 site-2 protease family protein [Clostridia bacterium]